MSGAWSQKPRKEFWSTVSRFAKAKNTTPTHIIMMAKMNMSRRPSQMSSGECLNLLLNAVPLASTKKFRPSVPLFQLIASRQPAEVVGKNCACLMTPTIKATADARSTIPVMPKTVFGLHMKVAGS